MADVFSKEKRSKIMSGIRSKDTNIEIIVRKYLFANGFRFRKNDRRFPGTPDIVLPKYKTIIFINGCFWHGHKDCKLYRLPKSNTEFWKNKIQKNISNDVMNKRLLEEMGWKVITIWECELKSNAEICLQELVNKIRT